MTDVRTDVSIDVKSPFEPEFTTALCEIKGWTPAGFYIDNDRSASNGKKREKWDELLADIKAGKIDAIAAWDQA